MEKKTARSTSLYVIIEQAKCSLSAQVEYRFEISIQPFLLQKVDGT